MKKIIALIFILNISVLSSQVLPGGSGKSRYNANESKSGKFVFALGLKAASAIDDYGLEFGGKAGLMASERIFIGFSIYTLLTHNIDFNLGEYNNSGTFLRMGYGGADFEYILPVFDRTHLSFGTLAGFGTIDLSASSDIDVPIGDGGDWFFITEPYAGINFRFWESLHAGLNISYRIVSGVDFYGLSGSDLNGPVLNFVLKSF